MPCQGQLLATLHNKKRAPQKLLRCDIETPFFFGRSLLWKGTAAAAQNRRCGFLSESRCRLSNGHGSICSEGQGACN